MIEGRGLWVEGAGSRVQGSGFRVQGSGFGFRMTGITNKQDAIVLGDAQRRDALWRQLLYIKGCRVSEAW